MNSCGAHETTTGILPQLLPSVAVYMLTLSHIDCSHRGIRPVLTILTLALSAGLYFTF